VAAGSLLLASAIAHLRRIAPVRLVMAVPELVDGEFTREFSVLCWVIALVIVIFLADCFCSGKAPDGAPLVLRGASSRAIGDPVAPRLGRALDLRRAHTADPFRLFDLGAARLRSC